MNISDLVYFIIKLIWNLIDFKLDLNLNQITLIHPSAVFDPFYIVTYKILFVIDIGRLMTRYPDSSVGRAMV